MPEWLVPAFIAAITLSFLIGIIFIYTNYYFKKAYLKIWGAGWIVLSIYFAISMLNASFNTYLSQSQLLISKQFQIVFSLTNGILMLSGSLSFEEKRLSWKWILLSFIVLLYSIFASLLKFPFIIATIPQYTYLGMIFIQAGRLLLKQGTSSTMGRKLASYSFILLGIHKMDFPFLRPVVWFAPIGFFLSPVLELLIAFGIFFSFFEVQREEIMETNKKYKDLFRFTRDAISLNDKRGYFSFPNPQAISLLGYDISELKSMQLTDLFLEEKDRILFWNELREEGIITNFRTKLKTKSNSIVTTLISCAPWNTVELVGHIINIRDISKFIEMENQIIVKDKLDALGTISSGIAHDMNNFLQGISGNIEILELHEQYVDYELDSLSDIRTLISHATKLVEDIQAFSTKKNMELEIIDLSLVIDEIFNRFTKSNEDIKFTNQVPSMECYSLITSSDFYRVLLNLIRNSIQAMQSNNSEIKEITVEYNGITNNFHHIVFKDTGGGIKPDIIGKIFDPFFTTKRKSKIKGTGLGLSIVHNIIAEKCNGQIWAESYEQQAIFHILLPVSDPLDTKSLDFENQTSVDGTDQTILIVEDDEFILKTFLNFLETRNFRVLKSITGTEAIQTYNNNRQNLHYIILDLGIPELSGEEVFKIIRDTSPNLPVIISTGNTDSEISIKEDKVTKILRKPYTLDNIQKVIKNFQK